MPGRALTHAGNREVSPSSTLQTVMVPGDGWQQESYPLYDPTRLPLELVTQDEGGALHQRTRERYTLTLTANHTTTRQTITLS